ncbi:uncharacterized protein LOC114387921 isoform X1 [Glycine soja]|uniref:uncharacterized protein isoform X1 n=1 Tax=Glycine max TaxID=3847 RepID=UPI0010392A9C|nr:uncharacterized protein LOC100527898 isoform X1 [Glycine max]XP_028203989.1 uncharacterized protein LOC114387921 isoform X1 [Glycine soja]
MRRRMASSAFMVICILHSVIAMTCGALMMFYMKEVYTFGHGVQAATKLLGSTPHDQLLIKTSDSFSGLLLVAIGFLLFMVSFVKDRDFQVFFAKGCTLLHLFMAMWRVYFERKVEDLALDWLRQTVGDFLLALSWVFFLVYSWREKMLILTCLVAGRQCIWQNPYFTYFNIVNAITCGRCICFSLLPSFFYYTCGVPSIFS